MSRVIGTAVAVIGGGQMGSGIAHAFLMDGARVTVVEPDAGGADRARDKIAGYVTRSCARAEPPQDPDLHLARLTMVAEIEQISDEVDLVVEAVPEIFAVKADVLTRAEKVVRETAVLASNTSSMSITRLGETLVRPERFIGTHFFNPVPSSVLVELVTGEQTDAAVTEAAAEAVSRLGKESIVVRDSPGFATSRLGIALGLEAIRMFEDGVASARDIDRAMVLGYRHPVGPLELTDLVGLDVRLAVAEYLEGELGSRFSPPTLLKTLVSEGKLGKKTGEGFHVWS